MAEHLGQLLAHGGGQLIDAVQKHMARCLSAYQSAAHGDGFQVRGSADVQDIAHESAAFEGAGCGVDEEQAGRVDVGVLQPAPPILNGSPQGHKHGATSGVEGLVDAFQDASFSVLGGIQGA